MQCIRCNRLVARGTCLQPAQLTRWLRSPVPSPLPISRASSISSRSHLIQRRRSVSPTLTPLRTFASVPSPPEPTPTSSSSLSSLLSPTHRRLVSSIRFLLDALPAALRLSVDDRSLVRDTQQQLDQVFLLVVVGEYNSGKSSFVNALLGGDYCKTGALPTTDKITILRYAPPTHATTQTPTTATPTPHMTDPNQPDLHSLYLPLPLLATLCIVDTPGTNAILRQHEALTTHFVPRSDAVLFLTSVERPFSESERLFMGRVRQWGKRLVVAVNKADLLDTDADRRRVMEYVKENVEKELHEPCTVFLVSARQAISARSTASAELLQASGIPQLERWLAESLSSGERMRLKLLSPVNVVGRILSVYETQLVEQESKSEADRRMIDEVDATIAQFERDVNEQVELEIAKADSLMYDRMNRVEQIVRERVVPSNLWSLMRGSWTEEWQRAFVGLEDGVQSVLSGMVDRVSECTKRATANINRIVQRHNQRMGAHALANQPVSAATSPHPASDTTTAPAQHALVPLLDTAVLSSSAPSHQQFVQLRQQVLNVLSSSAQQVLQRTIQSILQRSSLLTVSSAAISVAWLGIWLLYRDVLPTLALWLAPAFSVLHALLSLFFVWTGPSVLVAAQRRDMEQWRLEARRAMSGWVAEEVADRKRRLAAVRSDMERQVLGDQQAVQELRRTLTRLNSEVAELREQIRVAQ